MPENIEDRIPADSTRIDINESYELQYWSKKFGCTTQELWDAVTVAGVMVKDVAEYLNKPEPVSTTAS